MTSSKSGVAPAEQWVVNGRIVTPDGVIENGAILFRDGQIADIREADTWQNAIGDAKAVGGKVTDGGAKAVDRYAADAQAGAGTIPVVDAKGGWIIPGFIDVHVHGGAGHEYMEATREAFDAIHRFHMTQGTTTMLATTVTASKESLEQVMGATLAYQQEEMPYTQLAGVHLEGPSINPKWKGAQNEDFIVLPQMEWLEEWVQAYPGVIRIQTLAPDREGAIPYIQALVKHGIVAAAGHTGATYDQLEKAADAGLSHAVHTYNAMLGLHHREPGTLGAVLTDDRIVAEVIADGHHVHPAGVKLLFRAKDADKVVLITDAISAAGLGDGDFSLGGLSVVVKDGVARLKEDGALAGSTLTMINAFRFAIRQAGATVAEASRMASGNPARVIGVDNVTGSLAVGKQADVLLLDADLNLKQLWIKGISKLS